MSYLTPKILNTKYKTPTKILQCGVKRGVPNVYDSLDSIAAKVEGDAYCLQLLLLMLTFHFLVHFKVHSSFTGFCLRK